MFLRVLSFSYKLIVNLYFYVNCQISNNNKIITNSLCLPLQARAKMNKKPLSLYRAYARAFGADILLSSLFKLVAVMSSFIPPLALAGAIKFVSVAYYGEGTMDYEQVS